MSDETEARRSDGVVERDGDRDLLDAIVENIPNMVFVKDAEKLAFVLFNRAGEELLGMSRQDLLGKNDYDLFPPTDAAFFQGKDRETLRSKVLVDIAEEPLQTKNGVRWLHTKKVPILDRGGEPRYLLGISEDITERKATMTELRAAKARAEAAQAELEAFSYSVAHDLRTPLRGIDGFSHALAEEYGDKLDERGLDYLRRVREAAQRMARLIDDLLMLARVTRSDIQHARTDLSAIARAIVERLRTAEPGRDVSVTIASGLAANADPHLIELAMTQLIENAWKFTSKRERGEIEVGSKTTAGEVQFYVRDNGAGFEMEHKDRLFNAFQRLHPARDFEGTGIGLATVQRILRRHGGRVWAEGEVDRGATFFFVVEPIDRSEDGGLPGEGGSSITERRSR